MLLGYGGHENSRRRPSPVVVIALPGQAIDDRTESLYELIDHPNLSPKLGGTVSCRAWRRGGEHFVRHRRALTTPSPSRRPECRGLRTTPSRRRRLLLNRPSSPPVEEGQLRHNGVMSFDRVLVEPGVFRICFVCTGNICRSPMAEAVFRELIRARGWENVVSVLSAGTGEWHVGEPSDPRTLTSLTAHGYEGDGHRARQFEVDWFDKLDLIIASDRTHERILKSWAPNDEARSKVHLLLSFDSDNNGALDIPDPYYSNLAMFDSVLVMIERACAALFRQLEPGIRQGVS